MKDKDIDKSFGSWARLAAQRYFETKDSGERIDYPSGMRRDINDGKPRFDLLTPCGIPFEDQMLTRWAALMARGAKKYGARNWECADSIEEYQRFQDSAFRHFIQWLTGEEDEDHAAAVLFNVAAAEALWWRLMNEGLVVDEDTLN